MDGVDTASVAEPLFRAADPYPALIPPSNPKRRITDLARRRNAPDQTRERVHPRTLPAALAGPADAPKITRVLGDQGHVDRGLFGSSDFSGV